MQEALAAEFDGEISFLPSVPSTLTAPSVVVTPGDPFLAPITFGLVAETWEVLVVVSMKDKSSGIRQMRDLSLRVREAVSGVGGTWRGASSPRLPKSEPAKGLVLSLNTVAFNFDPNPPTP
jgi:hypothetical protein